MSIIVSELFLSACLTPLLQETPLRGSIFHGCGPSNPPLTLTFVHLPAPLFVVSAPAFSSPLHVCQKLTTLQGEQVGRLRQSPPPTCTLKRTNSHAGPTAKDPALLTEVEGGGVCGGWGDDKDDSLCGGTLSAAATRNLFRKNRILYTMVVGVKKGGTY